MLSEKSTLKQSGSNVIQVFESKEYVAYTQEAVVRQLQKNKFLKTQKNVNYRPNYYENQIIGYELLRIRQGTFEGQLIPFTNVGNYMAQAIRTIQVQNRKLIQNIIELGKEIQKV